MGLLFEILFELIFTFPVTRAVALAVLPALGLLLYVRRKDRLESESPKLIWQLVGLGAASTLVAMVLETAGIAVLTGLFTQENLIFQALHWLVVVGIGEEISKYLMLRLRTWKNPEYNCVFDGMVYAVAVSAGFALTENVIYMFRFGSGVLFMRALVSIPAHISFSVLMGTWYSIAKRCAVGGDAKKAKQAHVLAVLVPALAHGIFDFMAVNMQTTAMTLLFFAYVIAMFVLCFMTVKRAAERDTYLSAPVNGLHWS